MTSKFAVRRLKLSDVYNSREFENYISDKLGNYLFISDPDRADRIHAAAENGSDGSLYCEIIDDWREFVNDRYLVRLPERVKSKINAEIDSCEEWHKNKGSLYHEVG